MQGRIETVLNEKDINIIKAHEKEQLENYKKEHDIEDMTAKEQVDLMEMLLIQRSIGIHKLIDECVDVWYTNTKETPDRLKILYYGVQALRVSFSRLALNDIIEPLGLGRYLLDSDMLPEKNQIFDVIKQLSFNAYNEPKIIRQILQILDYYELNRQDIMTEYIDQIKFEK